MLVQDLSYRGASCSSPNRQGRGMTVDPFVFNKKPILTVLVLDQSASASFDLVL